MKKRIYLLCEPKHANLGDQAQLMCTLKDHLNMVLRRN